MNREREREEDNPEREIREGEEKGESGAGAKFIRSNKRHKGIYLPETSRDTREVTWDDL